MAWTPEEAAELRRRMLGPQETQYDSPAGSRRSENQDLDKMILLYGQIRAELGGAPSFRRAGHRRGFRKGDKY